MIKANALARTYDQIGVHSGVEAASPHRLILMLLDGALENVAKAKGFMQHGEVARKGEHIGWAITILGGLQASLDKERGGEIAENLDRLYDYMMRRLLKANKDDDLAILEEVGRLLGEIRSGWAQIESQVEVPQAG